jgi:hypothetical protein
VTDKTVKETSFYEDDDYLLEQVKSDPPFFYGVRKSDGHEGFMECYEYDDVKVVPITSEAVSKGAVLLPEKAAEYGTEEKLLGEVREHIVKWLDIPEDMVVLASYYILMSWVYDRLGTVCYLRALGDTGTGKTRFLDVVGRLLYKATLCSGATTPAPIFRLLERWHGSLVIDEADFAKSDSSSEVIKIFNTGFERGKPVVRCDKNDPKEIEFHETFGPKAIATRYSFFDKALESRCITTKMSETRRLDIPVCLTSKFFEKETELRNKLLMYRFRNLKKITPDAEVDLPGIEPRLRQATRSFSLLFAHDESMMRQFKTFMAGYQNELIEERASSWEGLIVNAVHELKGKEENVTPQLIADRINESAGRGEELSSRKVGRVLRSLGLETRVKKVEGKAQRVLKQEEGMLAVLFKKYVPGYDVTKVTLVTLTSENQEGNREAAEPASPPVIVTNVTNVTNVTLPKRLLDHMKKNDGDVVTSSAARLAGAVNESEVSVLNALEQLRSKGDLVTNGRGDYALAPPKAGG